jgi:hypothetical protein
MITGIAGIDMLGLASLMYDLRHFDMTGGGETTSGNDFFPFLKPTRILGIPLHRVSASQLNRKRISLPQYLRTTSLVPVDYCSAAKEY